MKTTKNREGTPIRMLVTAGNTQVPIDRVRCITNVFRGLTGAHIALAAHERGHQVTLLTSHPEVLAEPRHQGRVDDRLVVARYRTFDDLQDSMAELMSAGRLDVIFNLRPLAITRWLAYTPRHPIRVSAWRTSDGKAPTYLRRPSQIKVRARSRAMNPNCGSVWCAHLSW